MDTLSMLLNALATPFALILASPAVTYCLTEDEIKDKIMIMTLMAWYRGNEKQCHALLIATLYSHAPLQAPSVDSESVGCLTRPP